jgi:hypothetical protein
MPVASLDTEEVSCMYYISDKGPLQDLYQTLEDPIEELMFTEAEQDTCIGDWLQNMKRW